MTSTVIVGAVALAVLWLVAVLGLQRGAMYPAPPVPAGSAPPPDAEVLRVGPDADVEAWLLPPLTPPDGRPAPALLFTHGNGELIDFWPPAFEEPRRQGLAILLVEYPGYGRSGGRPTEESIVAAVVAAHDALASRPGIDADRIVAHGRSLGGGAACALAARRPLAALILESTFTDVAALARPFGVPRALVRDPFDNLAVVREYRGPVLIVHGDRDRIVPPSHARRLHEAAADSELVLLPHGHNDMPRAWGAVLEFLRRRGIVEP